jgi:hypothetical protein
MNIIKGYMNYLLNKKILLSVALPSFILAIFIYANSTSVDFTESSIDIIAESQQNQISQVSNTILASEFKISNSITKSHITELDIINDKLTMSQPLLFEHISTIKAEHREIISQMKIQGIEIGEIEKMPPSLKLIVSTYLEITPSNLSIQELSSSSLSSTDWYYLNKLANSSDFKALLKNNELTKEFLQFSNLKRLYGMERSTANSKY